MAEAVLYETTVGDLDHDQPAAARTPESGGARRLCRAFAAFRADESSAVLVWTGPARRPSAPAPT